ncbi:hypothetical protein SAMN05421823_112143 [Catalinimonas alkaloidigena]|uniref:Uncharacterized protein n=1 Tax=Catalinimonas alkaloidigena TaxID=1075417 RepID=A0A1G9SFG0_9BACT|nr:hypothetical protein SAMN05421823_112143 [Catalinimonas alkaloidigena]
MRVVSRRQKTRLPLTDFEKQGQLSDFLNMLKARIDPRTTALEIATFGSR